MTDEEFWGPGIKPGDRVHDRRDGLVHRVLETLFGNACTTPCDSYACRCAYDWKAGEQSSAPRWKVFDEVNCLDCIARGG